ncbi:MAG TPA: DUF721 domain-containing protein, partial [Thalassospira sp.]|nr:DUF721 domain-containing protein [Thalassospira sp.]
AKIEDPHLREVLTRLGRRISGDVHARGQPGQKK